MTPPTITRRRALITAAGAAAGLFWLYRRSSSDADESFVVTSKEALVRVYRDSPRMADQIYKDQKLRLSLVNGKYRIEGADGSVVMCLPEVAAPRQTALTTGVCRGAFPTADDRGLGCRFYILLDQCVHQ